MSMIPLIGLEPVRRRHSLPWSQTRRDTLPARHGLSEDSMYLIGSGDARSRKVRAIPTTGPVASHQQSSPPSFFASGKQLA
jgi:hypothetical protein